MTTLLHKAAAPAAVTTTEPQAADPVSAPAPAPVPASGTGAAAAVSAVTTTETETQPEVALYVVFIFPLRHLFLHSMSSFV